MHNGFKVSVLRYSNDYLLIYDHKYDWPPRTEKQKLNEVNLTRGQYNGFMSPKTKSTVRKYLSTWIQSVDIIRTSPHRHNAKKKPYLTFVTLTLPSKQIHDDNEIKRKILIPFIQELRRTHDVWNYFWRAESQKNGNIHFHLIIDSYIDAITLRGTWNKHVDKLDYVREFTRSHGHNDPNSTDIHKLRDIKSASAYVLKYVSKDTGYRPIKGRIHGCSDRVRVLTPYEIEIDENGSDFIAEALANEFSKVIREDQYTIIRVKASNLNSSSALKFKARVKVYLTDIALDLYTNKEASSAEIELSCKIQEEEERQDEYLQMGLPFDYELDSAFYSNPQF